MKRRDFLKTSLLSGAAMAVAPMQLFTSCSDGEKKQAAAPAPELKISFQEGNAPGETLAEKFDYMEANGVVGFEPGGGNLASRVEELK